MVEKREGGGGEGRGRKKMKTYKNPTMTALFKKKYTKRRDWRVPRMEREIKKHRSVTSSSRNEKERERARTKVSSW